MTAKLIALPLALICSSLLLSDLSKGQLSYPQDTIPANFQQNFRPDFQPSFQRQNSKQQISKLQSDRLQTMHTPRIVIWSWEHDDDLSWLDPKLAGVAYYAGTIVLGRDNATLLKRKNFLHINDQVILMPSFRIEKCRPNERISELAFCRALDIVAAYAKEKKAAAIQIDFDATPLDRQPYLKFLQGLKQRLPADSAISITALGSWCLYDKWLQGAMVDETVAMMFSLGREKKETLAALGQMPLDSGAPCTQSIGLSISEDATNEKLVEANCISPAKRIYAFSSLGWTKSRFEELMAEVAR